MKMKTEQFWEAVEEFKKANPSLTETMEIYKSAKELMDIYHEHMSYLHPIPVTGASDRTEIESP